MSENIRTSMASPQLSLRDLLGKPYTDAVCEARAFIEGNDGRALTAIAGKRSTLPQSGTREGSMI
jgi:hypothetical protein